MTVGGGGGRAVDVAAAAVTTPRVIRVKGGPEATRPHIGQSAMTGAAPAYRLPGSSRRVGASTGSAAGAPHQVGEADLFHPAQIGVVSTHFRFAPFNHLCDVEIAPAHTS